MSSNLLINESPLIVLPSLAKYTGLNEAIFLQQVHYWLNNPKIGRVADGKKWVRNTLSEWVNDNFIFWDISTMKRIIKNLEGDGLILSRKDLNKIKIDNTKWYTVNYDLLNTIDSPVDRISEKSEKRKQARAQRGESTLCTSAKVQNGLSDGSKCTSAKVQSVPDNTIDYQTKNTNKEKTTTTKIHTHDPMPTPVHEDKSSSSFSLIQLINYLNFYAECELSYASDGMLRIWRERDAIEITVIDKPIFLEGEAEGIVLQIHEKKLKSSFETKEKHIERIQRGINLAPEHCPHLYINTDDICCAICKKDGSGNWFSLNQLIRYWLECGFKPSLIISANVYIVFSKDRSNIPEDDLSLDIDCDFSKSRRDIHNYESVANNETLQPGEVLKLIQAEPNTCPHPLKQEKADICVLCEGNVDSSLYNQPAFLGAVAKDESSSSFSLNQLMRVYLKEGFEAPKARSLLGTSFFLKKDRYSTSFPVKDRYPDEASIMFPPRDPDLSIVSEYTRRLVDFSKMKKITYDEALNIIQAEPNVCPHPLTEEKTSACVLCGEVVVTSDSSKPAVIEDEFINFTFINFTLFRIIRYLISLEWECIGIRDNKIVMEKGLKLIELHKESFKWQLLKVLHDGLGIPYDEPLAEEVVKQSDTCPHYFAKEPKCRICGNDVFMGEVLVRKGGDIYTKEGFHSIKKLILERWADNPLTPYRMIRFWMSKGWELYRKTDDFVSLTPPEGTYTHAFVPNKFTRYESIFPFMDICSVEPDNISAYDSILEHPDKCPHFGLSDGSGTCKICLNKIISEQYITPKKFTVNQIMHFFLGLEWGFVDISAARVTFINPEGTKRYNLLIRSLALEGIQYAELKAISEIAGIKDFTELRNQILDQPDKCPHPASFLTSLGESCSICLQVLGSPKDGTGPNLGQHEPTESANKSSKSPKLGAPPTSPQSKIVSKPVLQHEPTDTYFTLYQVVQFMASIGWQVGTTQEGNKKMFIVFSPDGTYTVDDNNQVTVKDATHAIFLEYVRETLSNLTQHTNIVKPFFDIHALNNEDIVARISSQPNECPDLLFEASARSKPVALPEGSVYLFPLFKNVSASADKPVAPPEDNLPPPPPKPKTLAQARPTKTVTMKVPTPKPLALAEKLGEQFDQIINDFTTKAKMDFSLDVATGKLKKLHISIYKLTDLNLEKTRDIFDYVLEQLDTKSKASLNYMSKIISNIVNAGSLEAHINKHEGRTDIKTVLAQSGKQKGDPNAMYTRYAGMMPPETALNLVRSHFKDQAWQPMAVSNDR